MVVLFLGIKSVYSYKSERNYRGRCLGRPVTSYDGSRDFHLQNHGLITTERCFSSCGNESLIMYKLTYHKLKKTFFKVMQMQSTSIFSNVLHSRPFLSFLCFARVLLQFWAVILIFKLILWQFDQCWNCLKERDLAPLIQISGAPAVWKVVQAREIFLRANIPMATHKNLSIELYVDDSCFVWNYILLCEGDESDEKRSYTVIRSKINLTVSSWGW